MYKWMLDRTIPIKIGSKITECESGGERLENLVYVLWEPSTGDRMYTCNDCMLKLTQSRLEI